VDVVSNSLVALVSLVLLESSPLVEVVISVLLDPSLVLKLALVLLVVQVRKLTAAELPVPNVLSTSTTQPLEELVFLALVVSSPLELEQLSASSATVVSPSLVQLAPTVLLEPMQ